MGILRLLQGGEIELWDDVFKPEFDDKVAPDLGDVFRGGGGSLYADPVEFFKRTHLTKSMVELIEEIAEVLNGGKGNAIYLLTSLFGGGKTHTLITLYHAFSNSHALKELSPELAAKVATVGKPKVIVMDGTRKDLIPNPRDPYRVDGFEIKTIWGMLAYRLGAYAKIGEFDREGAPAPTVDRIMEILQEAGGPVLILIDEIVQYVVNVSKSSELKDYASKVLVFLDFLARAIERVSKVVLVVAIQAEPGEKGIIKEKEAYRGYSSSIVDNLRRETSKVVNPVPPSDIVMVLKKRIFKKVPEDEAERARDKLYKEYRKYPHVFGTEADWFHGIDAKDSYPFHPKYIEVLQEFISRNEDLQKTRDAIRITRKIVRKLIQLNNDMDFIMPWHIDLVDKDVRRMVITNSFSKFELVASRDIVTEDGYRGLVNNCSKPELAYRIATVIFLKTYTYEGFKVIPAFPNTMEIALLVYEPETFKREHLGPVDIVNALSEMSDKLLYLAVDEVEERYWFTEYPSIIEYVKRKSKDILRERVRELYDEMAKFLEEEIVGKEEGGRVFARDKVEVISYLEDPKEVEISDELVLRLVVVLRPGFTNDDARRIILMRGDRGKRIYRNTIAVLCPSDRNEFEETLHILAEKIAAEEIRNEIEKLYPENKEFQKIQRNRLNEHLKKINRNLASHMLKVLTKAYYPTMVDGKDDVKEILIAPGDSLISQIEDGLKDYKTGPKLKERVEFNELANFLKKNYQMDIESGGRAYKFKDILDIFYEVPSSPFTTRSAIEEAIREGVREGRIGVWIGGKLYWKRIGPEDGMDVPDRVDENAEVLPYKIAAKKLIEELREESGQRNVGDKVIITKYEIVTEDGSFDLEDFIRTRSGWEEILRSKEAKLIKLEREVRHGFLLKLEPSYLEVDPGEPIVVKVIAEPINSYQYTIKLIKSRGSLSQEVGRTPLEARWDLGVINEVGSHRVEIRAIGEDGYKQTAALNIVVRGAEEISIVAELGDAHVGAKLLGIVPENPASLRLALDTLVNLNMEAMIQKLVVEFEDGLQVTYGRTADIRRARLTLEKVLSSLQGLRVSNFQCEIGLREPLQLDSSKITQLARLSQSRLVKFRLLVPKR